MKILLSFFLALTAFTAGAQSTNPPGVPVFPAATPPPLTANYYGTNDPNGHITAGFGSRYIENASGTFTEFIKTNSTGNTGWAVFTGGGGGGGFTGTQVASAISDTNVNDIVPRIGGKVDIAAGFAGNLTITNGTYTTWNLPNGTRLRTNSASPNDWELFATNGLIKIGAGSLTKYTFDPVLGNLTFASVVALVNIGGNFYGLGVTNASGAYTEDISGNVTATSFSGSGAGITALNASSLSSGTVPQGRLPDPMNLNQANIGIAWVTNVVMPTNWLAGPVVDFSKGSEVVVLTTNISLTTMVNDLVGGDNTKKITMLASGADRTVTVNSSWGVDTRCPYLSGATYTLTNGTKMAFLFQKQTSFTTNVGTRFISQ